MRTEGWGFGSAIYFCERYPSYPFIEIMLTSLKLSGFITYTTVGYGDLYPKSPAGRAIFTFWALLGVGGLTVLISVGSNCSFPTLAF